MTLRVIAGTAKGRKLQSVPGGTTRPSGSRLKEALFSTLGPRILGARVLDLYAGSGALGIEALSRGATNATFVEQEAGAVAAIKANLVSAGLESQAEIVPRPVQSYLDQEDGQPFDVVLIDPPYEIGLPSEVITKLQSKQRLHSETTLVVEIASRLLPVEAPAGFDRVAVKRYGDSALVYLAFAGQS